MPGDKITARVYAKYVDSNYPDIQQALLNFLISLGTGCTNGPLIDGGGPGSLGGSIFPYPGYLERENDSGTAPKAYLNYLVFDRDFNFLNGGYKPLTTNARETGDLLPKGAGHDALTFEEGEIKITEPGFVYIYFSNENASRVEVFFDDFEVTHTKSPVVQVDDYYPFGLTFNSYKRENSVENKIRFQGQEHVDELGSNWDSFKWRNHQPDIGRFFNVDPLTDKYVYNSPYAFAENRVIDGRELEGLEWVNSTGQQIYNPKSGYTEHATRNDQRLGNSLQGTIKGREQFAKLINANHPITIGVNMSDQPVKTKTGGILAADTKNDRDSYVDLKTGKVDEVEEKKSEIVVNIASMDLLLEKGGTFSGESVKGLTFDEFLGAVLGHEIEHTTDASNIIDANKENPEKPAHDVSRQIIQETKQQNENEKKKE